jgi:nickel/cobalt transporter (NicO) family protein
MPMIPAAKAGRATRAGGVVLVATAILLIVPLVDQAFAQGSPFGGPRLGPPVAPSATGIIGWIFAKQAEFYRQFSGLVRAAKTDGSAAWSLMGLSFLYGIFHAAGPGHGKAVISSYLVANDETWLRGVVLSFASALFQAIVAIALVGIAAAVLNLTARRINTTVNAIETISYAMIVLIGLRLLWVKGRAFFVALHRVRQPALDHGLAVTPSCDCSNHHGHSHDHDHVHDHSQHPRRDHGHAHPHHGCDDASAWGHSHAPEPEDLKGPGGWRRGLSAAVAVGLRPCSGAILVLVFALAQGLFWVGIGSTFLMALGTSVTVAAIATIAVWASGWARHLAGTRGELGTLAMRAIEVGAALFVTAFGLLLFGGYMVNERMIGF